MLSVYRLSLSLLILSLFCVYCVYRATLDDPRPSSNCFSSIHPSSPVCAKIASFFRKGGGGGGVKCSFDKRELCSESKGNRARVGKF